MASKRGFRERAFGLSGPRSATSCHYVALLNQFSAGMKDDAPLTPKDMQLRDAIRRWLVRYIKRARQSVKNQKREDAETSEARPPVTKWGHGLFPRLHWSALGQRLFLLRK